MHFSTRVLLKQNSISDLTIFMHFSFIFLLNTPAILTNLKAAFSFFYFTENGHSPSHVKSVTILFYILIIPENSLCYFCLHKHIDLYHISCHFNVIVSLAYIYTFQYLKCIFVYISYLGLFNSSLISETYAPICIQVFKSL